MLRYATLAVLLAAFGADLASAACSFPNGTDQGINWWSCQANSPITFLSAKPVDPTTGAIKYPIVLTQKAYVQAQITNNGPQVNKVRLDLTLWEYSGSSSCSWTTVPTFGLLSNLDGCTNGIPCPIKQGNQTLLVTLDFSKFDAIIRLLKNGAYQLEFAITDKDTGNKACIMVQADCLTS